MWRFVLGQQRGNPPSIFLRLTVPPNCWVLISRPIIFSKSLLRDYLVLEIAGIRPSPSTRLSTCFKREGEVEDIPLPLACLGWKEICPQGSPWGHQFGAMIASPSGARHSHSVSIKTVWPTSFEYLGPAFEQRLYSPEPNIQVLGAT